MIRDKKCERRFERSLMAEVEIVKVYARRMHNAHMNGYTDPSAKEHIKNAFFKILAAAYD